MSEPLQVGDHVRWSSDPRGLAGGMLRATFKHKLEDWAVVYWGGVGTPVCVPLAELARRAIPERPVA